MKVYKVFWIENNDFMSIFGYPYQSKNLEFIKYSKKGWNERLEGCGPFCAFKNLEDAKDFLSLYTGKFKIFEIEGKESKEIYVFVKYLEDLFIPSDGTILLDRFKIVKEVEV